MAGLASIRTVESGATRSLRDFERALKTIKRVMVKAAQVEGRKAFKRMGARYATSAYANRRGVLGRIKPYSARHGKRKRALKLDMRPGVMRKGILKTIQSPKAFIKTDGGFIIDLEKPDITITGRATLGKSQRNLAGKRLIGKLDGKRQVIGISIKAQVTNRRSFRVNNYIGHFADRKAPGLGSITTGDERKLIDAVTEASREHLRSIKGASRYLSRNAAAKLELKIGRLLK